MTGPGVGQASFAGLGIQDLLVLAAWELGDQGREVAACSLLRVAGTLEADLWAVTGPRARLLRTLTIAVPMRASVRDEIVKRLH